MASRGPFEEDDDDWDNEANDCLIFDPVDPANSGDEDDEEDEEQPSPQAAPTPKKPTKLNAVASMKEHDEFIKSHVLVINEEAEAEGTPHNKEDILSYNESKHVLKVGNKVVMSSTFDPPRDRRSSWNIAKRMHTSEPTSISHTIHRPSMISPEFAQAFLAKEGPFEVTCKKIETALDFIKRAGAQADKLIFEFEDEPFKSNKEKIKALQQKTIAKSKSMEDDLVLKSPQE